MQLIGNIENWTPALESITHFNKLKSAKNGFISNVCLNSPTNNYCVFYTFDASFNAEKKWKKKKTEALKRLM